jgi:hypothetical protein
VGVLLGALLIYLPLPDALSDIRNRRSDCRWNGWSRPYQRHPKVCIVLSIPCGPLAAPRGLGPRVALSVGSISPLLALTF